MRGLRRSSCCWSSPSHSAGTRIATRPAARRRRRAQAGQGLQRRVGQDRGDLDQVGVGRADSARRSPEREWKIVSAAGRAARRRPRSPARRRTCPRSRSSASSTRTRRTSRNTAWRSRASKWHSSPAASSRRCSSGRRRHRDRPLRQAGRRARRCSSSRPPRVDLQQDDVRSARQGDGQGRSRQARCAGVHGRRQDLAVREARRRMADRRAGRRRGPISLPSKGS